MLQAFAVSILLHFTPQKSEFDALGVVEHKKRVT
jgi:hypothetical protein